MLPTRSRPASAAELPADYQDCVIAFGGAAGLLHFGNSLLPKIDMMRFCIMVRSAYPQS